MNIVGVQKMKLLINVLFLMLIAPFVFAEGGSEEKFVEGVNYIPIRPYVVVNYGGPGKVRYIRAEISLRVEDEKTAKEVAHHMPLIRDTLIMFMSGVSEEQMSSGDGKETMRKDTLARLNEVIGPQIEAGHAAHEEKKDEKKDEHAKDEKSKDEQVAGPISDLLFDNLTVQK